MNTKFKDLAINTKFTFQGYGAVYTKVSEKKAAFKGHNTTVAPNSAVIVLETKMVPRDQILDGETIIVNSTLVDWPFDVPEGYVERVALL